MDNERIIKNFNYIQRNIAATFDFYYLHPKDVQIIAVSKNQTTETIETLLKAGHRVFAENRVGEAFDKWVSLKAHYPDTELHLIGSLQTNKVKKALSLFDVIQTIDRIELIDAIIKTRQTQDGTHSCQFFIQVNTGNEPQKSGVSIKDFPDLFDYAFKAGMEISGLMCIPPVEEEASFHFGILQSLIKDFSTPERQLLMSAGMSDDYDKAIICNTDYIRIGTGLFRLRSG